MFLPGWFQELSGQKACNPCPPGFHCQSLGPSPLPCPAGYICPTESPDSQPLPCPKGTYSRSQGLTTSGKNPERVCTYFPSHHNKTVLEQILFSLNGLP